MYRTLHTCSIGREVGAGGTDSAVHHIFKPESVGSLCCDDAGSFHRILERSVAENPAMEGQSEHVSRTQHFAFERQPDITGQAVVFTCLVLIADYYFELGGFLIQGIQRADHVAKEVGWPL